MKLAVVNVGGSQQDIPSLLIATPILHELFRWIFGDKAMELEALSCNNCGGPLSVPESANFVTCNHCSTQLVIRRTESSTFTEELGEIKANQAQMMEKLARIERQNRVEQLNREWERERQKFVTTNKHGKQGEPNEIGAIVFGVLMAGFGLFWTIQTYAMTSRMPSGMGSKLFPFFGVIFIFAGIGAGIYGYYHAKDYRVAQRRFQRRKTEALRSDPANADVRQDLEHIPTPDEYMQQLGTEETH